MSEPKLAAPGAGIPWYQKLILHVYVKPFVAARERPENSKARFQKTTDKVFKELQGLTEEQLNKKVLVPKQIGLEDSSRYWSIAMSVEHLIIVGRGISDIVRSLSQEKPFAQPVNIAEVKPKGSPSAQSVIEEYRKFATEEFPALKMTPSKAKHFHPWFGDMTSNEWYWLLGTHQGIHLQQIREIKKGL